MLMDHARGLRARWAALWRRDAVERELDDEFAFHLDMATRAGVERGLPPAEAARQARLALGGVDRHKEDARDARGLNWLQESWTDMRRAARLLRAQPAFSAAAILTLALGIGANTAIFSAVKTVLLAPSPFAQPQRIMMLWETDRGSGTRHEPASWPDVVDFRAQSRALSAIGSVVGQDVTLSSGGEPERVSGVAVTPNFLSLLGVRALRGRIFTERDGQMGAPVAVMLGEAFWRSHFNGDPAVVGSKIMVDEQPATVVGIVPTDADLGIQQVHDRADYAPSYSGGDVAVWEAFQPTATAYPRTTHPFLTIGRLAPNATLASAQQELTAIAARLERAYPNNAHRGVNVEQYSNVVFGPARTVLYVLLAAVTLVLLVTCANVANLLLARTTARAREVAVRRALGASNARIRRQFIAESLVLVAAGAAGGLATAFVALRVLIALAPADVPRLAGAHIDGGVLAYTAAISLLVAIIFGLLPALHVRRADIQNTLKEQSGRTVSDSRRAARFRSALVVAEVALAVALVAAAGLLLRSLWQLERVKPGFRTDRVLEAQYQLPATRYPINYRQWPKAPEVTQFHARFLAAVREIPGVAAATIAAGSPIDPGYTNSFTIVGREAESAKFPEIRTRFFTPGYLATLGVPLLSGRDFNDGDVVSAPQVVLINHTAAERYFPSRNPIGSELRFWGVTRRIVGVIGDERFEGLNAPPEPAVYGPMAQNPQSQATLLVRAAGDDPAALAPALRRALQSVDPRLPLFGVMPLKSAVSATIARPRFSAALLAVFGGAAMLLALIGVHGMLSYSVAQRRTEMGIRMALGADSGTVVRLVVYEGLRLALLGVAIGVAIALAASRALASLVFGISAHDPATLTSVALAVVATAALASIVPAVRAVRVDPMTALRAE